MKNYYKLERVLQILLIILSCIFAVINAAMAVTGFVTDTNIVSSILYAIATPLWTTNAIIWILYYLSTKKAHSMWETFEED